MRTAVEESVAGRGVERHRNSNAVCLTSHLFIVVLSETTGYPQIYISLTNRYFVFHVSVANET